MQGQAVAMPCQKTHASEECSTISKESWCLLAKTGLAGTRQLAHATATSVELWAVA